MIRQIACECGFVARDTTDEGVVELTQAHIAAAHPALAGSTSPAEIRTWIELVPV
jgi:hypothetical protein